MNNNHSEWFDLWMQQSNAFFKSAEENLKPVFEAKGFSHPEDYTQQINAWLDALKQQWQLTELTAEQKKYQEYWQNMASMCTEACDLMQKEWVKRAADNHPINNVRELYELWLNCCSTIYRKSILQQSMQKNYGEFVNAAFDFWKKAMPQ